MSTDFSLKTRQLVAERAKFGCEYCLFPELFAVHSFEIDHILSKKHGGTNLLENLAFACFHCNRHKGTDISSYDDLTGNLTAFYNPRKQIWTEHFLFQNAEIVALTAEARVTIKILKLNDIQRIEERQALIEIGIF